MRRARSEAASSGRGVLAVIAFSLILSSCTGGASDPPSKPGVTKPAVTKPAVAKPAVEKLAPPPEVGDCWNTSPGLLVGVSWEGSDSAVPCSQTHNAMTYRVGSLPAGFNYATIETDRLKTTSVVTDSCNDAAAHTYLGHGNFRPPLRVENAFFAPSSQQWAAGARWFRCDLGFPNNFIDPNQRMEWQPLPADLRAAVEADDRPFSICSNGSLKSGPSRPNVTFGKCDTGMHWVVTRSVDIAKKNHEPFPGIKVLRRRALRACQSRLEHWATWGRAADWHDGRTRASCWGKWSGS
jgi:Septum formation